MPNLLASIELTSAGLTPASWADMPGMSAVVDVESTESVILLIATVPLGEDLIQPSNGAEFRFAVGGVREGPHGLATQGGTGGQNALDLTSFAYAKTGLTGSQTFSLQWQITNEDPLASTTKPRTLQIIELLPGDTLDILDTILTSAAGIDSAVAYATAGGLSSAVNVANNSLILMSATLPLSDVDGVNRTANLRLADGGVVEGAEINISSDNTNEAGGASSLLRAKTGISGAKTFSLQWKTEQAEADGQIDLTRVRSFQVLEFLPEPQPAFVISTDLVVFGMSSFVGGMTFDGALLLDVDDSEALLVRKDGDAGDVFLVDTIGGRVALPQPEQVSIGSGTFIDNAQVNITGAFVDDYGGGPIKTVKLLVDGSLTGDATRTEGLFGAVFQATIVTQTATENIGNISQVRIDEPSITDNLTGDITNAQTLWVTDVPTEGERNFGLVVDSGGGGDGLVRLGRSVNAGLKLLVSGAGGFDSQFDNNAVVRISSIFSSDGSQDFTTLLHVDSRLIGAAGDTDHISGVFFNASLQTQSATEDVTDMSQLRVGAPVLTTNLTGNIINGSTVLIEGAPTGAATTNSYALNVVSGLTRLGGGLETLTVSGAGPHSIAGPVEITDTDTRALLVSQSSFGAEIFFVDTNNDEVRLPTGSLFALSGTIGAAAFTVTSLIQWSDANAPRINNVASTATVPPIIPNRADTTTGIGGVSGEISLIVGSTEAVNIDSAGVVITGTLAVSGAGPHAIAGTPSGIIGLIISETFTSDGSSTLASGVFVTQTLVGASGDTTSLTGTTFISAITTQTETESIANISQVEINEPFITDNLTGDITNAQTLLIVGSPTEGINNFAIRSTGAAPSLFIGTQFVVGTSTVVDRIQFLLAGNFTSGGGSTDAQVLTLNGQLTGASGDTGFLAGAYFTSSIVTQTATESITDIAQVRIDEPTITDNLTGDITMAQTLLLTGSPTEGLSNFTVRSTGLAPTMFQGLQFVIGPGPIPVADYRQVLFTGAFPSGGGATEATKFRVEGRLTGASGDITRLTGAEFGCGVTTQAVAEVVASVSQVHIEEPSIILGAGSSITNAQTLLVVSAPTEGVNNYALRVAAGATLLGGEFEHTGSTFGIFSTTPTTQPAAYTRNAVVVEDRTLLASASATTLNNNNVLAALIADLQSLGIIG